MMQLSEEFAELGKELRGEGDDQATLQRMVQLAVKHVDACTGASITLTHGRRARGLASSDPNAAAADELQFHLAEGPCFHAVDHEATYVLLDTTDADDQQRWPGFCAALGQDTPYRCMLSLALTAEASAALNLYAEQPAAFTGTDVTTAAIIAAHTSSLVALFQAERLAQSLEAALQSNREIGTAIGVLMTYHKITRDDAFTLLRSASQNLHRKLRDIATEVVDTGTLPEPYGQAPPGQWLEIDDG